MDDITAFITTAVTIVNVFPVSAESVLRVVAVGSADESLQGGPIRKQCSIPGPCWKVCDWADKHHESLIYWWHI